MKNYDYGRGFKPISAWGYIGYTILWSIPAIGWIIWLCSVIGAKNKNVKNFARMPLCALLLVLIIGVVIGIAGVVLQLLGIVDFAVIADQLTELFKGIADLVTNFIA